MAHRNERKAPGDARLSLKPRVWMQVFLPFGSPEYVGLGFMVFATLVSPLPGVGFLTKSSTQNDTPMMVFATLVSPLLLYMYKYTCR